MLSAPGLSGCSAGISCAPRRDLRQERHCRGRWVRRELFASPTLLGLVRRVLSTSCWGSGEKGDGSGRAPRAWEVLASPEKFERAGAWNTSPNVPSAQSFPADALSRSMQAPEEFGMHFYFDIRFPKSVFVLSVVLYSPVYSTVLYTVWRDRTVQSVSPVSPVLSLLYRTVQSCTESRSCTVLYVQSCT